MSTSMNEAKKASSVVGKKFQQTSMWLYGKDTQTWLTQAYEQAVQAQKERQQEENKIYPVVRTYDEDYYHEDEESISSSSNSSSASSQSSSSSSSTRNNKDDDETTGQQHQSNQKEEKVHQSATAPPKTQGTVNLLTIPKTPKKKKIKNNNNKKMRRMQQEINVHYANLMTTQIPVTVVSSGDESTKTTFYQMDLPSALLSKQEQLYGSLVSRTKSYLDLSTALSEKSNMVVVLILQSGRFAGGIFQQDKCIDHKSFQHYTVRKGQGKAQSTQDANKKAKSMGSQLRRQGEVKLQTEVKELLGTEWAERIRTASLILISCPKTMMGTMFGEEGVGAGVLLSRNDPRVRKIPMTVGRPTFEAVQVVHQVLMKVMVRQTDGPATISSSLADEKEEEEEKTTSTKEGTETSMQPAPELIVQEESAPEPEIIELTPLHELCRDGDHEGLLRHLISSSESSEDSINQLAGPDFMAPLHYAAAASNVPEEDAGACVYDLLVSGGADPTILDSRLRPPYFVAANDKIREAFRRARATLGEDYCDWAASKVGPPLSDSDIQDKKAKEAEKRRRKKAKAKERKAKEKEAQDAAAKELERQKAEEEAHAKRGGKTCDMCQKPIRGKKNAFKRLEYVYCSTDCVTKHKRELMASAAMARFGG
eukprot:scaffold1775_cov83-Cylindrotheca_fusiformis.AAC.2